MENQINRLIWGGDAERYHTFKTLRTETVHHHSAIVAHLVTLLMPPSTPPLAAFKMVVAALRHDLAEGSANGGGVRAAGDVPAPTKRLVDGLKGKIDDYEEQLLAEDGVPMPTLDAHKHHILKLADNMAGMVFCIQEAALGSKLSRYAYGTYTSYLAKMKMNAQQWSVLNELQNMWERVMPSYYDVPYERISDDDSE